MKQLEELPDFILSELSDFLDSDSVLCESETLILEVKGVQVSVKFQRDEDEFIFGTPAFEVLP